MAAPRTEPIVRCPKPYATAKRTQSADVGREKATFPHLTVDLLIEKAGKKEGLEGLFFQPP